LFKKIGTLNSVFFSIITASAFVGLLGFVIDAVSPYTNQFFVISTLLAIISATFLYARNFKFIFAFNKNLKSSILSAVLAVASAIFLVIPIAIYRDAPGMIYFLSSGEDNASHYAMFERNFIQKSTPYFDTRPTGLIDSLKIYPQAIHSSSAFAYSTIFDAKNLNTSKSLKLYYFVVVAACASLTYIISELVGRYIKGRIKYIAMVLSAAGLFIGATLFLAGWGFLTQIISLTYILSIVYLLTFRDEKRRNLTDRAADLSLFGLLVIGVVFSWYLLAPVLVAILYKKIRTAVSDKRLRHLVLLPVIIACAAPILVNLLLGKGSGAINEPGGVYIYGAFAIGIVLLSVLVYIFTAIKFGKKIIKDNLEVSLLILSAYISTIGIGLYQLVTVGSLRYYFYKSLYLLLIIAVITIVLFITYYLKNIRPKSLYRVSIVFVVAIVVGIYLGLKPTYPAVYVHNWFNHSITPSEIKPAILIKDSSGSILYKDIIYTNSCNYTENYILNRWTGAIFLSENNDRSIMAVNALKHANVVTVNNDYLKKYPNTLILQSPCLD
jgi:hypothetical protein